MNKYKFYSAFFRSFFSGSLYRDVASNWRGLAFTYLFIVQSICLVFLLFRLHLSLSEYIRIELPPILDQIPTITIANGTASTEEYRPYFIISPTDKKLLAVIDTTEQYTSLEQAEARILLTKREVIFERNEYETRTFSFQELDSLKIDRLLIDNFLKTIQRYFAIVVYPFVLIYYFGYRIIQVMFYALIGLIMARILQIQLSYSIMVRLVSVAITPVLFLEAIFRLFGISFLPGWSFIGIFIVLCYIYFALKANTKQRYDKIERLSKLASSYLNQGKYDEAESLFKKALEMRKKLLGENHISVVENFNDLAILYYSQRRYLEAEFILKKALKLNKQLLGEEHINVATNINNLAQLYQAEERYLEAETFLKKALEIRKNLLGKNHIDVANNLYSLALLYLNQGRYSEAEHLFKETLELRKKLLGEDHTDVVQNINDLGILYYSQRRYSEAEPFFKKALELDKKLLGEDHPNVLNHINNLASLYYSQGKYLEAEPLYIKALELAEKLLGEGHPNVANILNYLGSLYYSQERYSEAEPFFLKELKLRKKLLGEYHPNIAHSLNNLASLYLNQKRYNKAEPLYLQALELAEKLLGENHPSTIIIKEGYERMKWERGQLN